MSERVQEVWMLKAESGLYVAMAGHKCSQTNRQAYAAKFPTEAAALAYAMPGEKPKRFVRHVKD